MACLSEYESNPDSGLNLSNFIDVGYFILSSRCIISFAPFSLLPILIESKEGGCPREDPDRVESIQRSV